MGGGGLPDRANPARWNNCPLKSAPGKAWISSSSGQGVAERHCAINQVKGHGLCLIKQEPNLPLVVDGEPIEFCPLAPDTDYAVKVGAHFLALRGGRKVEQWLRGLDCTQWTLHDTANNRVDGPMGLEELCQFAKDQQRHPQTLVQPSGLSKGFFLQDAYEVVASLKAAAAEPAFAGRAADQRAGPGGEVVHLPGVLAQIRRGRHHAPGHTRLVAGRPGAWAKTRRNGLWPPASMIAARRSTPWACLAPKSPVPIAGARCRPVSPRCRIISFP